MRKMILSVALACLCGLLTADLAGACHRGWGGGWGRCCGWGGGWGRCCGWGWGGGWGGCYGGGYWYGGYSGYAGGSYMVPSGSYLAAAPVPATLVVNLPADAVLTVDGERTTSTSAQRVFRTPALNPGRDFEYTLTAKVVRAGREEVIEQRVTVRAGEQTTVRLELPTPAAAE
jgi:uncharacterized protein (TIGR03000 family)